MRENILEKLNQLFIGCTDKIKAIYFTSKSQEVMKFELFGHQIIEEDGIISILEDIDKRYSTPNTITIDPLNVDSVTYEDDKTDDSMIHIRKVIVWLTDMSRIEMSTVAIG